MRDIFVSIIIPVYNSQDYLEQCLESLLRQTFSNFEIVCVNDGSTDGSQEILNKYVEKYNGIIKSVYQENAGSGSARNTGIDNSTGEYIVFVDSDDRIREDMIEVLYNIATKEDADLVTCGIERIDEITGKTLTKDMVKVKREVMEVNSRNVDEILFVNPGPCNKMHRRKLFSDARFYNIPVVDDLMLMIEFMPLVKKISFVPEVMYYYKVRKSSSSNTTEYSTFTQMKKILIEKKSKYVEKKLDSEYIEYLDKLAFIHVGTSMMYRISYIKNINIRKELKETKKYLDENFIGWRKISFFRSLCSFNFRKIMIGGIAMLYKLGLAIIFIKTYRFIIDRLKVDVKW